MKEHNEKNYLSEAIKAASPRIEAELRTAIEREINVPQESAWKNKPEKKRKTYAEDFFEKFPDAPTYENGDPLCCRYNAYGCHELCTTIGGDCTACWNEEMEAEE